MCRPHLGVIFEEKPKAWFEEIGGASTDVADLDAIAVIEWLAQATSPTAATLTAEEA
jgi:hypothetical protein